MFLPQGLCTGCFFCLLPLPPQVCTQMSSSEWKILWLSYNIGMLPQLGFFLGNLSLSNTVDSGSFIDLTNTCIALSTGQMVLSIFQALAQLILRQSRRWGCLPFHRWRNCGTQLGVLKESMCSDTPVAVSTPGAPDHGLTYHSPLKGTRAPGTNGWFQIWSKESTKWVCKICLWKTLRKWPKNHVRPQRVQEPAQSGPNDRSRQTEYPNK